MAALAQSEGVAVLHAYNTNPTPDELELLISSPGGLEMGLRVAQGLRSASHDTHNAFRCRVGHVHTFTEVTLTLSALSLPLTSVVWAVQCGGGWAPAAGLARAAWRRAV